MTVITDPAGIRAYRLLAIKKGLEMELKHGLRHSRNLAWIAAKAETGAKTKRQALALIEKKLAELEKSA